MGFLVVLVYVYAVSKAWNVAVLRCAAGCLSGRRSHFFRPSDASQIVEIASGWDSGDRNAVVRRRRGIENV